MVCVECFVVPVVFLLLSFAKQIFTYIYSLFVPPQETPAPPPFDPSCINLAAHGLAPPKTVSHAEKTEDEDDDEDEVNVMTEETKEAPLIRKKPLKA